MSDHVGAPGMPDCQENLVVCLAIKTPRNAPIEMAIVKRLPVRFVFLNHQPRNTCGHEAQSSTERYGPNTRRRFGLTHCYTDGLCLRLPTW